MELYQRIEMILAIKKMPKYVLAEKINAKQNTIGRYFCAEQQDKLKLHLWEIADLFPDINRDWLFFEEGKMLKADDDLARAEKTKELEKEIERLQTQIRVEGASDQGAPTDTEKAAG